MAPAPLGDVLVATDFSDGARWAFERALQLPVAPSATIHVLHVAHGRWSSDACARESHDELVAWIERARGSSRRPVDAVVVRGDPAVEIARHARGVDVVVCGLTAPVDEETPVRTKTLLRIARRAERPLLVVGRSASHPYRRAAVALDLSDASLEVARAAVRIAPGAERLHLVHAARVPFESFIRDHAGERLEDARAALHRVREAVSDAGPMLTTAVVEGEARGSVLDELERSRSELVVVGTHGGGRVARAFFGSFAGSMIARASADVLVTRLPRRGPPARSPSR